MERNGTEFRQSKLISTEDWAANETFTMHLVSRQCNINRISSNYLAEILTLRNFSTIGLSVITDASHMKMARYAIQVAVCALF